MSQVSKTKGTGKASHLSLLLSLSCYREKPEVQTVPATGRVVSLSQMSVLILKDHLPLILGLLVPSWPLLKIKYYAKAPPTVT